MRKEKEKKKRKNGHAAEAAARLLRRGSLFIWRTVKRGFPEAARKNEAEVRKMLALLGDEKTESADEYYADRIGAAVMVLAAGAVMAFAAHRSAVSGGLLTAEGSVSRAAYGKGSVETTLEAEKEDGTTIGPFVVEVGAMQYTKEQTHALFLEASAVMTERILGENESLSQVSEPLALVSRLPGYPFRIVWETGNYARLRTDGTPVTEHLPPGGERVMLTAVYGYGEEEWRQTIPVTVRAKEADPAQAAYRELSDAIREADRASIHEESMPLPETFRDGTVRWREIPEDESRRILLLALAASGIMFFARGGELKKKLRAREEALAAEYPAFVSKLALYMSAGMTIRAVFLKLASAEGASCLRKELVKSANELKSGVSETVCYERFALRCGRQEYAKLSSLLTQNLKKGSSGLLPLLREEARIAVNGRMDRAKVRGEQANTKMMAPMTMMLFVVMVIVMAPAFMAL